MDLLTGFIFCSPLKSKRAEEVVQAYLNEVYYIFRGSRKILSDNGTEFKSKGFEEVLKKLGCDVRDYSPPYKPQLNGKIECFHKFLKACMGKHIGKNLKWDDVIPMATAAYNFFLHTPSKKQHFFLMFGQDPLTGLRQLLGEATRYLGEGDGKLNLTALQNTCQLAAQNAQMVREKSEVDESSVPPAFQPGDLVTLRDHTTRAFDPKYKREYRVIKFLGKTQVLLRNSKGEETKHHVAYLKKTNPVQETVGKIPDFKKFARAAKLQLNPDKVPDLKWEYEATKITQVAEINEVDTCKKVQETAKALILHLCYRYICPAKKQRSLENLIRCYSFIMCIQSMYRECKAIKLVFTVTCRTMCTVTKVITQIYCCC